LDGVDTKSIFSTAVEACSAPFDDSRFSLVASGAEIAVMSEGLTLSLALDASSEFSPSVVFQASLEFGISSTFKPSLSVAPSLVSTPSFPFVASESFAESATLLGPVSPGGAAEQVSGRALASGAIGGGLGGLAALAALVLLFLLKRKKKDVIAPVEDDVETGSRTIDEDDAYVSEYGLSDAVQQVDSEEGGEDMPQGIPEVESEGSDMEGLSERNPDDIEAAETDPDES
jgi:hypothetical protein